jgi:Rap1a immunity proteins
MSAMNKLSCFIFFLASLAPVYAQTNPSNPNLVHSGNEFLSFCSDSVEDQPQSSMFTQGDCMGFVVGVNDGILLAYIVQNRPLPFCVPHEVINGQILRVVVKYIKDHPQKGYVQTVILEMYALKDAFPCSSQSKKP